MDTKLAKKIREAEKADGYYIAVVMLKKKQLQAWYSFKDFYREDLPKAMTMIQELTKKEYLSKASGNYRKDRKKK